jgi:hypothetical protein
VDERLVVAAAVAAATIGWASPRELAWQEQLGAHPCHVGPPPTRRLRTAYAIVHASCANADLARRAALVGYQRTLPPGRLIFNKNTSSYTNTDYSRIASRIAHKRVAAHCWDFSDWASLNAEVGALYDKGAEFHAAGFASIGASSIELDPYSCTTLALLQAKAYAYDYTSEARGFGAEVDVLAHEATHARGIANEAETECDAIQLIPETTVWLGLSKRVGRLFADAYWRAYRFEPKGYSTPKCRDGGPYDLHPGTHLWP